MSLLQKFLQCLDGAWNLQNVALPIALTLPDVDINRSFNNGTTPLTALFEVLVALDWVNSSQYRPQVIEHNLETLLNVPGIDANQPDEHRRFVLIEFLKLRSFVPHNLMTRPELDRNIRDRDTLDTLLILIARKGSIIQPPFQFQ